MEKKGHPMAFKERVEDAKKRLFPDKAQLNQADQIRLKVDRLSATCAVCVFITVCSIAAAGSAQASVKKQIDDAHKEMTSIAVATADIQAGATLTSDMIAEASVPKEYLGGDVVAFGDAQDLVGSTAIVKISAGTGLTTASFTGKTNNSSLANKLEKKQVATTIAVTASSDMAQSLLHQNDKVTLYYFLPYNEKTTAYRWKYDKKLFDAEDAEDGIIDGKVRVKLASNLTVSALGSHIDYQDMVKSGESRSDTSTPSANYSTVTVASSSAVAERIRAVQDDGYQIWFTLSATVDDKTLK